MIAPHRTWLAAVLAGAAAVLTFAATPAAHAGATPHARPAGAASAGVLRQLPGKRGCWSDDKELGCASLPGFHPDALLNRRAPAFTPDGLAGLLASPYALTPLVRTPATGALASPPAASHCYAPVAVTGCRRVRALDDTPAVALSPDGQNAYAASADGIAIFRRDGVSGALEQLPDELGCVAEIVKERCAPGRGIGTPTSLALSPDGASLYATGPASTGGALARPAALAIFRRDRATGALTQLDGPAGCVARASDDGCAAPRVEPGSAVAVAPDGMSVYTASSRGVAAFRRDPATGALTPLEGVSACLASGTAGCAPLRGASSLSALAVAPDGRSVYVASPPSGTLAALRRDPLTGALAQPPGAAGCLSARRRAQCGRVASLSDVIDVAVTPDGRNVYAASPGEHDDGGLTLLRRTAATGALRPLPGEWGCLNRYGTGGCHLGTDLSSPSGIAVAPDGRSVYVQFSNALALFARTESSSASRSQ